MKITSVSQRTILVVFILNMVSTYDIIRTSNISVCSDFYPVFKIKDEITGIQERFLGNYTLRVIAGGTSIQDLTVFNSNSNM